MREKQRENQTMQTREKCAISCASSGKVGGEILLTLFFCHIAGIDVRIHLDASGRKRSAVHDPDIIHNIQTTLRNPNEYSNPPSTSPSPPDLLYALSASKKTLGPFGQKR